MLTATKIRLYPTATQEELLAKAFGCTRWLWNSSLAETQRVYQETGKGLGQFALNNRIPQLKVQFPWLKETHSQVLQSVNLNLSRAFVNFFDRRARYPKFKRKFGKQSIQYPQGVTLDGSELYLPKIGSVKGVVHRTILGTIKTVTVSRDKSGKYFASILTETGTVAPVVSFEGKILGIDVGLTHLAVTSDGLKFDNPRHLLKASLNLARKQQHLSRKAKGSSNRNKARLIVAKAHERTANARRDWLHKLSKRLVDENQVIAVEDLHVKGMMKNHCLSKAISDVGWGMFTSFLEYKAARAGKGVVKVNRFFPSSKACSCCMHAQDSMPLDVRTWTCDVCGTLHDRDVNAAQNIRNEAIRMLLSSNMPAGIAGTANGGSVRQAKGRKSSVLAGACEVGSSGL